MTAIAAAGAEPLLQVDRIVKEFKVKGRGFRSPTKLLRAVDGVSLELAAGETLGIVGESGCGKTTLGRVLIGLETATAGTVHIGATIVPFDDPASVRRLRRRMQMVFQDPYNSLDPRMTVFDLISEPWVVYPDASPSDRRHAVGQLLERVGLDAADMDRLARTFSGGQRQRIGIARALALGPEVLILDEPVSALDVSIQAQIVELLRQIQEELGLSMLLIAHDLAVVRSLAHRIAVMYLGRIVELGPADVVYAQPAHPYTKALLSAIPTFAGQEIERVRLEGEVPSPIDPPSGCRFRTRCWKAQDVCAEVDPPLERRPTGQEVACHFPEV